MSTELALSVHFHFCVSLVILVAVVEIKNEEQEIGVIYEKKKILFACKINSF